ncbi:MAG TPA: hypothetical protein VKD22_01830 [Ramlibacter sp.]|nr:hypothetical protein [Ramlibacter sp.]
MEARSFDGCFARLDEIAELKDGWLPGAEESEAPTARSVAIARGIVGYMRAHGHPVPDVGVAEGGQVDVAWGEPPDLNWVIIYPDEATMYDEDDAFVTLPVHWDAEECAKAIINYIW